MKVRLIGNTDTADYVIYVGSREHYDGQAFGEGRVYEVIQAFQKVHGVQCVSISRTTYLAGEYCEPGWAIRLINYPRFRSGAGRRRTYMHEMATWLCEHLRQNRVSLVGPDTTWLYESDDAVEHPARKTP